MLPRGLELLFLLIEVKKGVRFALEQVRNINLAGLTVENNIIPALEPRERVSITLVVGHQIKESLAAVFIRPQPFPLSSHCTCVLIITLLHRDISLGFLQLRLFDSAHQLI